MLSSFEAREIRQAKEVLERELQTAEQMQERLKEREHLRIKRKSLWSRIRAYFGELF